MTVEHLPRPRKIETTIEGRCSKCKEVIYRETVEEDVWRGREKRNIMDIRDTHTHEEGE